MRFTLAILLLFVGKGLVARSGILRRYSIPESLVGGLACALVVFVLYYGAGIVVSFDLEARDALLLYFFAAIGLSTDARTLRHGGRPFADPVGVGHRVHGAAEPGRDGDGTRLRPGSARRARWSGSISLTGGVGTTLAWSDHFVQNLGIAQAQELGLAANMIGLIAACTIGGPIASLLMRRHRLQAGDSALEIGTLHSDEQHARLDYYGVLLALLWLNLALMLGYGINALVARTPVTLPAFVGCLLAGILLRMAADWMRPSGGGTFMELAEHAARHCPGLRYLTGPVSDHGADGTQARELQPGACLHHGGDAGEIALVIAFVFADCFSGNGQGSPNPQ